MDKTKMDQKAVLIITASGTNILGLLEAEDESNVKIRIPYVLTPTNQAFSLYFVPGIYKSEEQDLIVYEFNQTQIVFIDRHPKFSEIHYNLYSNDRAARSNIVMAGKSSLKH